MTCLYYITIFTILIHRYINDGFYDGIELSVVVDGNCAAARVISQADLEYFEEVAPT